MLWAAKSVVLVKGFEGSRFTETRELEAVF